MNILLNDEYLWILMNIMNTYELLTNNIIIVDIMNTCIYIYIYIYTRISNIICKHIHRCLGEPLPRHPAAETAIQPPIWCFLNRGNPDVQLKTINYAIVRNCKVQSQKIWLKLKSKLYLFTIYMYICMCRHIYIYIYTYKHTYRFRFFARDMTIVYTSRCVRVILAQGPC